MADVPVEARTPLLQSWLRPWPVLCAALGATLLAGLLKGVDATSTAPIRALLLLAGLVMAGSAVVKAVRRRTEDLDNRLEVSSQIAIASLVPLGAFLGIDWEWDSARMVLIALIGVALFGALLVLLPSQARRFLISLLILYHFGGIFTAVLSVKPPNAPPMWLANQLWVHVYQPYVQFLYVNNAYHFYSPDPGPPTMLWAHLKYADGTTEWTKFPDRQNSPVPMHYQRMLAMTESTNNVAVLPDVLFQLRQKHREDAMTAHKLQIPPHPFVLPNLQLQVPNEYSKVMVASYARHLARENPWKNSPGNKLVRLRLYRVKHEIISPYDVATGHSPLEKKHYLAYYQGQFDSEGRMQFDDVVEPKTQQVVKFGDPFLYWLIPIMQDATNNVTDYVEMHAKAEYQRKE
jgi:hypothetical protein